MAIVLIKKNKGWTVGWTVGWTKSIFFKLNNELKKVLFNTILHKNNKLKGFNFKYISH